MQYFCNVLNYAIRTVRSLQNAKWPIDFGRRELPRKLAPHQLPQQNPRDDERRSAEDLRDEQEGGGHSTFRGWPGTPDICEIATGGAGGSGDQ